MAFEIQFNIMMCSLCIKPLPIQQFIKNFHYGIQNSVWYNHIHSQPQFHAAMWKEFIVRTTTIYTVCQRSQNFTTIFNALLKTVIIQSTPPNLFSLKLIFEHWLVNRISAWHKHNQNQWHTFLLFSSDCLMCHYRHDQKTCQLCNWIKYLGAKYHTTWPT